ncbi:MAG: Hsp20 family protein [Alphaproteobacteria bacterium]|nr:Hsp20 family protein [Alphaproteobacteria bacterium]
MRNFDLSPLFRSTIGFDRLSQVLDAASRGEEPSGYPPYNIEKLSEDGYRIVMAVAGFQPDQIELVQEGNVLAIVGKALPEPEGAVYLHRGIARRAFERRFELADHIEVKGAKIENGLLVVELERRVPEALKPRKIRVNGQPLAA